MPAYAAPAEECRAELREKGSRFLAVIRPVGEESAARAALAAVQREFPAATHHCWAWRLGSPPRERSSDAGEPAGTAGTPILQVLRGAGLSDVVAVVVRWFGGVKLGKGGLARAYAAAARQALAGLPVIARVPAVRLALVVPFDKLGGVKRLLRPPEVLLESAAYGPSATLVLTVQEGRVEALTEALRALGIESPKPMK